MRSSEVFMSLFRDESIPYEEMVEIDNKLTKMESNLKTTRDYLEKWKAQLSLIKKLMGDMELSILESRKENFMMEFGGFNRNVNLNEQMEKEGIEEES
jgi:hypothetical protein